MVWICIAPTATQEVFPEASDACLAGLCVTSASIFHIPTCKSLQDVAHGTESACLLQDLHRFFRCIAYIEEAAQLVVVGEDGRAGQAQTSQQLAASLSVSVWNVSNPSRVTLATFAGIRQVCPKTALLFLHKWQDPLAAIVPL